MNSDSFYVHLLSNGSKEEFPQNTNSSFTNLLSKPLELGDGWEVALNEIIYPKPSTSDTKMMLIYIDIIREQFVGDGFSNLLKVTSLSIEAGHNEFENLCYYNLRLQTIPSISIRITDETGKEIPFDSTKNICLNLHFRRKLYKTS